MKNSILPLLLVGVFLVLSCSKDANSNDRFDEFELREGKLMNKKECFELVFPLEIIAPNGTAISLENEDEFYSQIKNWYENNPDTKEKPSLSYPVDIKFKGDKLLTIVNEDEMIKTKKYCDDKEDCFAMVYPISFTMPDGSITEMNNEIEMWSLIKSWYNNNPGVEGKPVLVYPADIIFNDEKTVTANNDEEMIKYKKACK